MKLSRKLLLKDAWGPLRNFFNQRSLLFIIKNLGLITFQDAVVSPNNIALYLSRHSTFISEISARKELGNTKHGCYHFLWHYRRDVEAAVLIISKRTGACVEESNRKESRIAEKGACALACTHAFVPFGVYGSRGLLIKRERERQRYAHTHMCTHTCKRYIEREGVRITAKARGREQRSVFGGGFRADGRPIVLRDEGRRRLPRQPSVPTSLGLL